MSAILAMLLAAAAPQAAAAQPEADPPSVPMDVAKARVEKVKVILAAAASGDERSIKDVSTLDATGNFLGTLSPLSPVSIAPLKNCTRKGPFTVSPYGVMVKMTCTGTLPADSTIFVNFVNEMVSSVVAGPSAPEVAGGGR